MSVACEVCYEFYSEYPQSRLPRALPCCGHDFCTGCIASLCETDRLPVCPKCRAPLFQNKRPSESPALDETAQMRQTDAAANVDAPVADEGPPPSRCQKQHVNEHQDRYIEWPVLRCLLQLDERIDFSPNTNTTASVSTVSINILQKALQAATLTALQIEVNGRMQREIIDALTTDELQNELAKRQQSTAQVPPSDSSPCQPTKRQQSGAFDMPVHSAPPACGTFTSSCSSCRCRSPPRRRCCAAEQHQQCCCCSRGCSNGNYYAHEWPPPSFLAGAYMEACPLCRPLPPRRPFDMILRHLFTVYVLLWHIFMGCLWHICLGTKKLFGLFKNIGREQRLQLIMIANALPLLIGSFYVFHNPTFFIQIRTPL